jgi:hypothetical protein
MLHVRPRELYGLIKSSGGAARHIQLLLVRFIYLAGVKRIMSEWSMYNVGGCNTTGAELDGLVYFGLQHTAAYVMLVIMEPRFSR